MTHDPYKRYLAYTPMGAGITLRVSFVALGTHTFVTVDDTATVRDVRVALAREGFDHHRLAFAGVPLADDERIADLGIRHGSTVHGVFGGTSRFPQTPSLGGSAGADEGE